MTHDMWHVTYHMLHVTCDIWREEKILSKFQDPSQGEPDAAELGANTDANHTCTKLF